MMQSFYLKCGIAEVDDAVASGKLYAFSTVGFQNGTLLIPHGVNLATIADDSPLYEFLVKNRVFPGWFAYHESLSTDLLFECRSVLEEHALVTFLKNGKFSKIQVDAIIEESLLALKAESLESDHNFVYRLDTCAKLYEDFPIDTYESILIEVGRYSSKYFQARNFDYFKKAFESKKNTDNVWWSLRYAGFIDDEILEFIEQRYLDSKLTLKQLERYAGFRYGINPKTLVDLSVHKNREIVKEVASNPNTPVDTLEMLALKHKTPNIRINIARNSATPKWLLVKIHESTKSNDIREAVEGNPLWSS